MKIILIQYCCFFFLPFAFSQNVQSVDNQKFIQVTGHGELTYLPDEIKYAIVISDENYDGYVDDNPDKIKEYKEMKKIKLQEKYKMVWQALKTEGITESSMYVQESYDFQNSELNDVQNTMILLKLNDFKKFRVIIQKLKDLKFCSGSLLEVQPLKMTELQDKAMLLAIENAKMKAEKLAKAVNATIGSVIQISELEENEDFSSMMQNEWTAYPPLNAVPNISNDKRINDEGKFTLKRSLSIRYALINQ